ncbi:DUF5339 family protein [Morganella morganii]|mgnify:FL=1|uniref:DUF5339 family protein n=1 Tax=Morganella morganii TaxID=582 RepID=UPI0006918B0A|nr:DUF5339 family protein [Morganella morganii]AUU00763.1 hypothetical protein MC49_011605 [Morganella morganii]AVD60668.1 hypothetical protein C4E49_15365 [Morganella morganii]EHZ6678794.1 hypothetical protein [Morganella morganii]EKU8061857.1 hypothetical protein [Morganella morganii]EKW8497849.1 hypothetical protein [Morganella morganii]
MMTNNRSAGEISPATEQDLTALIALDTVAAQEPQRCEAIRRRIEQKVCFVLRREGKIAGYGVLHYHFKKQFMELPADAQDAACKQDIDALARAKAMMEQQMPK